MCVWVGYDRRENGSLSMYYLCLIGSIGLGGGVHVLSSYYKYMVVGIFLLS